MQAAAFMVYWSRRFLSQDVAACASSLRNLQENMFIVFDVGPNGRKKKQLNSLKPMSAFFHLISQ